MTRDDIIRLAREAGFVGWLAETPFVTASFERFAALVAAAEREACAKLCEDARSLPDVGPLYCAAAIRARGV
jgi:hypothetical protein